MRFYTTEELGPTQAMLPSGALLCQSVVIARTGQQLYHTSEIGVGSDDPWSDGMVAVMRDEDEVFDERSMASFEGMPITLRHPDSEVAPDNWSQLAVGHAQNVRRQGDVLVADLILHDRRAIDAIRNGGWRGVSCGYSADYQEQSGQLRQHNIVGNHIALLPRDEAPRCGAMCMIGDTAPNRRTTMSAVQTADTPRRVTRAAITRSLADTKRAMDDLLRLASCKRKLARDQDAPKRIRKLGPAGSYSIENDGPDCWLVQHDQDEFEIGAGAQTGVAPPSAEPDVMEASPPRKMGPTMMGDALVRHRATTAARNRGAAFAEAFNQRQRARWGR